MQKKGDQTSPLGSHMKVQHIRYQCLLQAHEPNKEVIMKQTRLNLPAQEVFTPEGRRRSYCNRNLAKYVKEHKTKKACDMLKGTWTDAAQ